MPEGECPGGNCGGAQDVYYRSSTNGGRAFTHSVKITDRIIDRTLGVWSNNSHIHAPIGLVSTADTVYFTWQDTRNGNRDNSAEDVYFATLRLKGPPKERAEGGNEVPRWLLVTCGAALGMGAAMCVVALATRARAT